MVQHYVGPFQKLGLKASKYLTNKRKGGGHMFITKSWTNPKAQKKLTTSWVNFGPYSNFGGRKEIWLESDKSSSTRKKARCLTERQQTKSSTCFELNRLRARGVLTWKAFEMCSLMKQQYRKISRERIR